jgi:hypothetical protein
MPAKFSTWKFIIGECKQCKAVWMYEGWDDGKRYKVFKSGREPRLCKRCLDARRFGEYRYGCNGCGMQVRGQFEDVRDLVNVLGRSFCQACMIAFFGRYDPENPALIHVLSEMAVKKKGRKRYYDSEEAMRLAEEERRYGNRVRRLSHAKLRRYPEILNPNGHKVGASGVSRAYQLDHIVPISTCWEYQVLEVSASDIRNLQVIPWFVNLSRGSGIRLEQLIGWPYPVKRKRKRTRH